MICTRDERSLHGTFAEHGLTVVLPVGAILSFAHVFRGGLDRPLFIEKNKGVHVIIDSDALVDLLKEDLLLRCAAVWFFLSEEPFGVLLDDLPLCGKTHVVAGGFEHKLYFTADRFHHSGFDGDDVG